MGDLRARLGWEALLKPAPTLCPSPQEAGNQNRKKVQRETGSCLLSADLTGGARLTLAGLPGRPCAWPAVGLLEASVFKLQKVWGESHGRGGPSGVSSGGAPLCRLPVGACELQKSLRSQRKAPGDPCPEPHCRPAQTLLGPRPPRWPAADFSQSGHCPRWREAIRLGGGIVL